MGILDGLNAEQHEAVIHNTGPLLIIAGAGTGKTTVITRRIAYLIQQGLAKPEEILALTFTEKAAGEMEDRIGTLLPSGYFDLWVSTFHAFGEHILKDHALDIGLSNDFRLLSDIEQRLLLREHIDEFDLNYYRPKGNPTKFIQALISHFSRLKDEDITPEEYIAYAEKLQLDTDSVEYQKKKTKGMTEKEQAQFDESLRVKEVAYAYKKYQQLLREKNAFDFGDLIIETIHILKERPAILEQYRNQFKYIFVDEFQDTNYAQYDLIKLLAAPRNNLTVVADDDQSIYSFRGASMSNILTFKKDFPKARDISLIQNYRSTQNILDLAYDFIQHNNPNRLEETVSINKHLQSNSAIKKGHIQHIHTQTLEGEAKLVIDTIADLRKQKKITSWNEVAILIRANDQAQTFIPYFERSGIPYQFLASQGLFIKPIILDIISFLKLLDNYHESRALYRVLTFNLWHIPPEEVMLIVSHAHKYTQSLFETCKNIRSVQKLQKETYKTIESLLVLIGRLSNDCRSKTVGEIVLNFLEESGYLAWITKQDQQHQIEHILYLNQFYKYIQNFERSDQEKTVRNFIYELNMMMDAGEGGALQPDFEEGPESVKILTIHAAKGLEFEYVFVVNLVDKRFPSIGRKETIPIPDVLVKDVVPKGDWHIEEERRLFYVALTRAKSGLFLTSADDYGGARKKKPSRFLIESGFVNTVPTPTGEVLFQRSTALMHSTQKTIIKHVPTMFSFTQLTAFETCPWQYHFSFIVRIPTPGKPNFSFGKTIHNTLYEFVRRIKEEKEMAQGDLFDNTQHAATAHVSALTLDTLLAIYETKWINEWYPSKKRRDEFYEKGKEMLTNWFQMHHNAWPEILYIEKEFTIKIGQYAIKGAIDRIDKISNGLEIIDYKTGKVPKNGKKDPTQLYMYALAVQQILNEQSTQLTYYFIEDNIPVSVQFKQTELDATIEWIEEQIEEIRKGEFIPKPGFHCAHCDYKDI